MNKQVAIAKLVLVVLEKFALPVLGRLAKESENDVDDKIVAGLKTVVESLNKVVQ